MASCAARDRRGGLGLGLGFGLRRGKKIVGTTMTLGGQSASMLNRFYQVCAKTHASFSRKCTILTTCQTNTTGGGWTSGEWVVCTEEQAQAMEVAAAHDPGLRVRLAKEEPDEEESERWDFMS